MRSRDQLSQEEIGRAVRITAGTIGWWERRPTSRNPVTWRPLDLAGASFDVLVTRLGKLRWREDIDLFAAIDEEDLRALVSVVSAIELDADFMRRKLRATGMLRMSVLRDCSDVWLSEEADHGRCFDALARRLGGGSLAPLGGSRGTLRTDRRALLAFPAMWAARPCRRAARTGDVVRGLLVEHEAVVLAGSSPAERVAVRRATKMDFHPPGVDLLGRSECAGPMVVAVDLATLGSQASCLPGSVSPGQARCAPRPRPRPRSVRRGAGPGPPPVAQGGRRATRSGPAAIERHRTAPRRAVRPRGCVQTGHPDRELMEEER